MSEILSWIFGIAAFFLAVALYGTYTSDEVGHLSCYKIGSGSGPVSSDLLYLRPADSCRSDASVSCLSFEFQADGLLHAVDVRACTDRRPFFQESTHE